MDPRQPRPLPPAEAFDVIAALRADARSGRYGDAHIAYGPAGPPWCSPELLTAIANAAVQADALVHTHLLETVLERQFAETANGDGAVTNLSRVGLLNHRLFIAHGVWLDEDDRAALANAGTSVITNPSSNLRLHAGVAAIPEMLEAGINVAIGTDNMSLGGRDDMLNESRLLRALQRRPEIADTGLDPATVLGMASENGGKALGRPDVGVLRPGAVGDVVVLDIDTVRPPVETPVDELELLVSSARTDHIQAVICAGRVLIRHGRATRSHPNRSVTWPDRHLSETVTALLPFVRDHYTQSYSTPRSRSAAPKP